MEFSLAHLAPTKSTSWVTLWSVDLGAGPVELELAHAGPSNRPYEAARIKAYAAALRRTRGLDEVAAVQAARALDAELYVSHVLKGWRKVVNNGSDGAEVAFSAAGAKALVEQILQYAPGEWDVVTAHASNPRNYREVVDPEDLSGN